MNMKLFGLLSAFVIINLCSYAQGNEKRYASIDSFIFKTGPLLTSNVASITDSITLPFSSKADKARAIYTWIANNISLDPKLVRTADAKNTEPENVILYRKANALGFSLLFQEMCSQENIRCLSVDGYYKFNTAAFDELPDEVNHHWNVVQLGSSPSDWFYVDAALGSGLLDSKISLFTKRFSAAYFFSNSRVFNLAHFPNNQAWMLGEGPKNIKEFYALPLIGVAAYQLDINKLNPSTGKLIFQLNKSANFSFQTNKAALINNISITKGEGPKAQTERINFNSNSGGVSFDYKFKKEETTIFYIRINDEILCTYQLEVSE